MRRGPGPVFAFESLIAARRWQVYALRSIYVGLMLAGPDADLGAVGPDDHQPGGRGRDRPAVPPDGDRRPARRGAAGRPGGDRRRHLRRQGAGDAAPCLRHRPDRPRDHHGQAGGAAGPGAGPAGLRAAGPGPRQLPGRDRPRGGLGAELVTAGVAILCCTLALLASVWARKPHQALLLAYLLVGLWVGFVPMADRPLPDGTSHDDRGRRPAACPTRSSPRSRRSSRRAGRWACASRSSFFLVTLLISTGPGRPGELAAAADGPGPGEPAAEARAARRAGAPAWITCPGPRSTATRCSGASGTASGPRAGPGGSGRPTPSSRRWRASTSSAAITPGGATA